MLSCLFLLSFAIVFNFFGYGKAEDDESIETKVSALWSSGNRAMTEKNYEEAIRIYTSAIDIISDHKNIQKAPNLANVRNKYFYMRALAYEKMSDIKSALHDYIEVTKKVATDKIYENSKERVRNLCKSTCDFSCMDPVDAKNQQYTRVRKLISVYFDKDNNVRLDRLVAPIVRDNLPRNGTFTLNQILPTISINNIKSLHTISEELIEIADACPMLKNISPLALSLKLSSISESNEASAETVISDVSKLASKVKNSSMYNGVMSDIMTLSSVYLDHLVVGDTAGAMEILKVSLESDPDNSAYSSNYKMAKTINEIWNNFAKKEALETLINQYASGKKYFAPKEILESFQASSKAFKRTASPTRSIGYVEDRIYQNLSTLLNKIPLSTKNTYASQSALKSFAAEISCDRALDAGDYATPKELSLIIISSIMAKTITNALSAATKPFLEATEGLIEFMNVVLQQGSTINSEQLFVVLKNLLEDDGSLTAKRTLDKCRTDLNVVPSALKAALMLYNAHNFKKGGSSKQQDDDDDDEIMDILEDAERILSKLGSTDFENTKCISKKSPAFKVITEAGLSKTMPTMETQYNNLQSKHVVSDFYSVLGVRKSDPKNVIKKAYYKLAKKYHPDYLPSDADEEMKKKYSKKFAKVAEAWSVLGDDDQRRKYDSGQWLQEQQQQGNHTNAPRKFIQQHKQQAYSNGGHQQHFFMNGDGFGNGFPFGNFGSGGGNPFGGFQFVFNQM